MRNERALPDLGDDANTAVGDSETTPVCSRVLPTADRDEGDLRINRSFFMRTEESVTDVRVNTVLLAATKSDAVLEQPVAPPPKPSPRPLILRGLPPILVGVGLLLALAGVALLWLAR
jgi:hypothetical protein